MKNISQISKSITSLRRTMAVLTLVLSLGATTAWADGDGGFDGGSGKGVSTSLYDNGSSTAYVVYKTDSDGGGNGNDFGVVSSLYIGDASAYMYQSQGCSGTWEYYNICTVSLGWQVIDLTDSSIKKSNNYGLDISWDVPWSNCYRHPRGSKSNMGIDLHSSLNPGNYQVEFWYYMTGNTNSGCSQTKYYKNGDDNFWCKFTIPGFKNVTTSASFTAEPGGNESKTITFNHYGTALTTSNCVLSGTDAAKFSVTSINESGVTVQFNAPSTEGTYTATLTITDANSKTNVISLTGKSGYPTTVEIAGTPVVDNGPKVTLSGYLRYTGCDDGLLKRGFFYCEGSSCDVTTGSLKAEIDGETTIKAKETFSKTFSQSSNGTSLKANTTYCYKAYVYSESNSQYVLSDETGKFTTAKECQIAVNDTVYYTIDNTLDEDPCELRFQSIAAAIADAKKTHKNTSDATISAWINASGFVQVPLVFEVAYSSTAYGNADNKTRDTSLKNINGYSASYSAPSVTKPTERLIVRAKTPEKKPTIKGGLDMTQSRYITLKDLIITYSDNTGSSHAYSAIELGYCNESSMNSVEPGIFVNSDIHIIDCEIDATAFNCLHAVGCNGLVFDECEFNLMGTGTSTNDKMWGASVKLASCKNVQFTRNSLKGSHATTLFLQYAQNTLVMNNVFWNDNLFTDNVAFVRPVVINDNNTQHNLENVAIYYNTFYLEDHASSAYNVDFLRFGSTSSTNGSNEYKQKGQTDYYKADKIYFKWNNCYSYDDKISERNTDATAFQNVTLTTGNYSYNNFWSKGDSKPSDTGTPSGLVFGTNAMHINVEEQVCKSTATDPDELVYRGSLLNLGAKPDSDPTGLEVANKTYADRFGDLRRSEAGGDWTYGAFQQANIVEVDTIVWVGGNSGLWDVRSNWVTTSGRKLNCANFFSPQLHVIIPDAENLKNVPIIPSWDDTATRGEYPEEYVAAGLRASFSDVSQFAKNITIEAGGAIVGVENLNSGTLRYTGAKNSLTARRNEWVLVGGVIKPFASGHTGDAREVKSGDFYIADQKPHVYMQRFVVEGNTFKPGIPFTSLTEEVATNSAFGIMIPDQYGPLKVPASRYYTRYENNPAMVNDGTAPKTFKFEGRFANEGAMPQYSATTSWTFVNNSYPANLNVAKLRYDNSDAGLQAKVYDYNDKSWTDVESSSSESGAVYVKPNNGFAIKASSAKTVTTTLGQYGSGSTTYYKRAFDDTYLRLRVQNTSDATASTLTIRYNGEMIDKAFSYNETTPEVYVADGDEIYSTYGIDDAARVIPVSIRNKQANKNLTVRFSLSAVEGFESVILEDRLNSKTYDLTEGETPIFSGIAPGDCIGRFYLNINYAYEDVTSVDEGESDGSGSESRGIEIYEANGKQVVISSSDNVMLEQVYITDMSGRTTVKKLSDAHYNVLTLDGLQGVYVIKAVGDAMSKTEKVIVK
ncbi:MAG: T9SS type A sorting domain-containing protein [Bacteroidales bacterium]|nr:T9SS type A sorting domain-containing protein [Bacteroidales bacterium]